MGGARGSVGGARKSIWGSVRVGRGAIYRVVGGRWGESEARCEEPEDR